MSKVERVQLIREVAKRSRRVQLKLTHYPTRPVLDTKPKGRKMRGLYYNPVLTSENTARPLWMDEADAKRKETVKHKRRHEPHPLTVIAHKLPMKLPNIPSRSAKR